MTTVHLPPLLFGNKDPNVLPLQQYDERNISSTRYVELGWQIPTDLFPPTPLPPDSPPVSVSISLADIDAEFQYDPSRTFRVVSIGIESYSFRHKYNDQSAGLPVNGFTEGAREPIAIVCPQIQNISRARYVCLCVNDLSQGIGNVASYSFSGKIPSQLDFRVGLVNPDPRDEVVYNFNTNIVNPQWSCQFIRAFTIRLYIKASFEVNQIPVVGVPPSAFNRPVMGGGGGAGPVASAGTPPEAPSGGGSITRDDGQKQIADRIQTAIYAQLVHMEKAFLNSQDGASGGMEDDGREDEREAFRTGDWRNLPPEQITEGGGGGASSSAVAMRPSLWSGGGSSYPERSARAEFGTAGYGRLHPEVLKRRGGGLKKTTKPQSPQKKSTFRVEDITEVGTWDDVPDETVVVRSSGVPRGVISRRGVKFESGGGGAASMSPIQEEGFVAPKPFTSMTVSRQSIPSIGAVFESGGLPRVDPSSQLYISSNFEESIEMTPPDIPPVPAPPAPVAVAANTAVALAPGHNVMTILRYLTNIGLQRAGATASSVASGVATGATAMASGVGVAASGVGVVASGVGAVASGTVHGIHSGMTSVLGSAKDLTEEEQESPKSVMAVLGGTVSGVGESLAVAGSAAYAVGEKAYSVATLPVRGVIAVNNAIDKGSATISESRIGQAIGRLISGDDDGGGGAAAAEVPSTLPVPPRARPKPASAATASKAGTSGIQSSIASSIHPQSDAIMKAYSEGKLPKIPTSVGPPAGGGGGAAEGPRPSGRPEHAPTREREAPAPAPTAPAPEEMPKKAMSKWSQAEVEKYGPEYERRQLETVRSSGTLPKQLHYRIGNKWQFIPIATVYKGSLEGTGHAVAELDRAKHVPAVQEWLRIAKSNPKRVPK